jgi:hypothetical protein
MTSIPGRRFWLCVGLLAGVGCGGDEPMGPAPAVYEVVLRGGGVPVGAVYFLVEGGSVDTVEGTGFYTASAAYSGVATQVLVAGRDLSGTVVRVRVPDARVRYRASVLELAQGGTHQLLPPADYSLTLVRVAP